jgi:hypothetical protein
MLTHAQTLRNLSYPIAPFNNLDHGACLDFPVKLPLNISASLPQTLGQKTSTNLRVIQAASARQIACLKKDPPEKFILSFLAFVKIF